MRKLVSAIILALVPIPAYAQSTPQPNVTGGRAAVSARSATDGTTVFLPWMACTDAANNRVSCGSSQTTGPQTSANSQSVTPASDSDFASKANQTNGTQVVRAQDGYLEYNGAVAANGAQNGSFRSPPTYATRFLVRGVSDVPFTLNVTQSVDGSSTNTRIRSRTAVFNGQWYVAEASIPLSGLSTTSAQYRSQIINGPTASTTTVLTSAFTTGASDMPQGASGTIVQGAPSTPIQQGGTISASGGTATVAFVSSADTEIVNPSTGTLWGSWGTPGVNGANSYPIAPGGSYRPPNRPVGTFTLLSTAANQTYTVTRF